MRKVANDTHRILAGNDFQPTGSSLKTCNSLIKLFVRYTDTPEQLPGATEVQVVVATEDLDRVAFFFICQVDNPVLHDMGQRLIAYSRYIGSFFFADHYGHGILLTVEEDTTLWGLITKDVELPYVIFFRWKHVCVIPGHTTDQTNVVAVANELRHRIES